MNRKRFLLISALVVCAAIPAWLRLRRTSTSALSRPWFLSHVLEEDELRGIGSAYRSQNPVEASPFALKALLLNRIGGAFSGSDDEAMREALERNVTADFAAGRVLMLQGWIVSLTEARQCALFSLAPA